jgi:hypothetical protein
MGTAQGFVVPAQAPRRKRRTGPSRTAARCFCCFSMKLSAIGNVCSAEILDFGKYRGRKNSGARSLFPAVFAIIPCGGSASKSTC